MKIKKGFILHKLGDDYMAVAVGEAAEEFGSLIRINDTGAFIWELLKEGASREELIGKVCAEYEEAEESQVSDDIDEFLSIIEPALDYSDEDC